METPVPEMMPKTLSHNQRFKRIRSTFKQLSLTLNSNLISSQVYLGFMHSATGGQSVLKVGYTRGAGHS